ncbi:MAG: type VI secretion system protein TssA [Paraburkholderia tropica]|uniref:Type VI secretion system protein VasJ n=2 Tax=Burkholderiales TaxID=80840 RepID=A0ABX5MIL4_9BURK|nr:type VI secretion system protein TssA [Paraburkholderia tropica]MDE1139867.1 type VI secretion system protein TssA [Paraburkholderia tropica]PXX09000.1 type VI secretion system protein VasJ [Paraburkholderia tropica]PZW74229.1 type VI secretion system protein VasJ [Paraburkholderia tropica]
MNGYRALDLKHLLEPLEALQPAGHFDENDERYQIIDQEMVKLGGLHEASMDWSRIDEAARQYLTQQCKHFRVAGHLITACLRARSWQAWVDALGLLTGMVQDYWETGFPKPGPAGHAARRKLVAMLIGRLTEAQGALDPQAFEKDLQAQAQRALAAIQAAAIPAQLDAAPLATLELRLNQSVDATRAPEPTESRSSASSVRQAATGISEEFFSAGSALRLGEERENRRSLLTVAEFVNVQDAYDPTGYQLRRFALWGHLRAAPPARHEQRTELAGVPIDIVDSYQEALARNAVTPVLLQRVEKSVAGSPYWIRGSYLAAGIADRLEMKEVADAICHAAARFVRRMPMVAKLCFSDGRPFVDDETLHWLSGVASESSPAAAVQEYSSLRDELVAQLDREGVEVVLKRLQDMQAGFHAPRQRCHVTVIAADLLAARGLAWLAADLYANVARAMQGTLAAQWEPDLWGHLAKQLPPTVAIEQGRKGQEAS